MGGVGCISSWIIASALKGACTEQMHPKSSTETGWITLGFVTPCFWRGIHACTLRLHLLLQNIYFFNSFDLRIIYIIGQATHAILTIGNCHAPYLLVNFVGDVQASTALDASHRSRISFEFADSIYKAFIHIAFWRRVKRNIFNAIVTIFGWWWPRICLWVQEYTRGRRHCQRYCVRAACIKRSSPTWIHLSEKKSRKRQRDGLKLGVWYWYDLHPTVGTQTWPNLRGKWSRPTPSAASYASLVANPRWFKPVNYDLSVAWGCVKGTNGCNVKRILCIIVYFFWVVCHS